MYITAGVIFDPEQPAGTQAAPAGYSSRVAGLPLIIHTALVLQAAGIKRLFVISSTDTDELAGMIRRERRVEAKVDFIRIPAGTSRLDALLEINDMIKGNFVLVKEPVYFDVELAELIVAFDPGELPGAVIADYRIDKIEDRELGRRILAKGDLVMDYGPELSDFNCLDTGVYLFTRELLNILTEDRINSGGEFTFEQTLTALAHDDSLGIIDTQHALWHRVTDDYSLYRVEERLYKLIRQDSSGLEVQMETISIPVTRYVIAPIRIPGYVFGYLAHLFGLIGSLMLLRGGVSRTFLLLGAGWLLAGALSEQIACLLVRVQLSLDRHFVWQRRIGSDLITMIFLFMLGWGMRSEGGSELWRWVAVGTMALMAYHRYVVLGDTLLVRDRYSHLRVFRWWLTVGERPAWQRAMGHLLDIMSQRMFLLGLLLAMALLNSPMMALVLAAGTATILFVASLIHQIKRGRL